MKASKNNDLPGMTSPSRHGWGRLARQKSNRQINQGGPDQRHRHQCIGERTAVDITQSIKYLDGGDPIIVKHQWNAQLRKRPDKEDGPPGKKAGHEERNRYPPSPPQSGATE